MQWLAVFIAITDSGCYPLTWRKSATNQTTLSVNVLATDKKT